MNIERVLLTGSTGYIGSHTAVVLIQAGYEVTQFDSLRNSRSEAFDGIEQKIGIRPSFLKGRRKRCRWSGYCETRASKQPLPKSLGNPAAR